MIKQYLLLFCVFLFVSSSFVHADNTDNSILAKVGDISLSKKQFSLMIESLPLQHQAIISRNPELKINMIQHWVETTLLSQEALSVGIHKEPKVALQLQEKRRHMLANELASRKLPTPEGPSKKEIQNYYQQHPNKFSTPEQVRVRHILIRTKSSAAENKQDKALEKILEIQSRIARGEDFGALAREYSEDNGSKERDGDLGYFSRGQMVQEFEEAAFALETEKVSQPVHSPYGWHLIKVMDKKEAGLLPLEEVEKEIKTLITDQKNKQNLNLLLDDLRKKYPVTLY